MHPLNVPNVERRDVAGEEIASPRPLPGNLGTVTAVTSLAGGYRVSWNEQTQSASTGSTINADNKDSSTAIIPAAFLGSAVPVVGDTVLIFPMPGKDDWLGVLIPKRAGDPGGPAGPDCSQLVSTTSCFLLSVLSVSGNCACCIDDTQTFKLFPGATGIWQSVTEFATCNGSGVARLDTTDPCCRPKLTLIGVVPSGTTAPGTDYVMWPVGCGQVADGSVFADFAGVGPDVCGLAELCDCSACPDGTFENWLLSLDFSGITSDCESAMGGNWSLTRTTAGTCVWNVTKDAGDTGSPTGTLTVSGTTGTLVFSNGLTYALTPWDCTGSNVLSRTALGSCSDAPSTVTVCPVPQSGCSDNRFKVRLTCSASCADGSLLSGCCDPGIVPPDEIPVRINYLGKTVNGPFLDCNGDPHTDCVQGCVDDLLCGAPPASDPSFEFVPANLEGDYLLQYAAGLVFNTTGSVFDNFTLSGWHADFSLVDGEYIGSTYMQSPDCAYTPPQVRLFLYCHPTDGWSLYVFKLVSGVAYSQGLFSAHPYKSSIGLDCTTGAITSASGVVIGCGEASPGVYAIRYDYEVETGRNCAATVEHIPDPTWSCESGSCVEKFDGTGEFAALADCEAACGITPTETDCCDVELAAKPNLTVSISGGTESGTYTAVYSSFSGGWEFSTAGHSGLITCGSKIGLVGPWIVNGGGSDFYCTSSSCGPMTAGWSPTAAAEFGGGTALTVSV